MDCAADRHKALKGGLVLINALSQLKAKNLPSGKHGDGQGLWLVKRDKFAGKWVLRLTIHARRREMGLGPWPDVSIAEARERAAEARRAVRDGLDPIVEREKKRASTRKLTVKEAIDGCFAARQAELKRDGDAGRWMSPLRVHVLPKLARYPVEAVDQHVLKDTLAPIWHEKPEAAAKALNRMNLTLKHAAALGLDVDLQATMKARALLGKQRHEITHIPSLPYADAPAFYRWIESKRSVAALALRFLMLTVARTSEVRLAQFSEIEDGVWSLSPERTKTGAAHRVPLSSEALAVIEEARLMNDGPFLFPSQRGKPLSDMAMSTLMKRADHEARPHGFRATFRTWAEEKEDAPHEVKEACLGHTVDSGVVRAYQRSDRMEKRASLLERWAMFLAQ